MDLVPFTRPLLCLPYELYLEITSYIDFYISPEDEPGKYLDNERAPWLNCLRSIARNKLGQAEWVRKVAIRGARSRIDYKNCPKVGEKTPSAQCIARLNSERIQLHNLLLTIFTKVKKLQTYSGDRKDKVLSNAYPEIRHASFKCLKELSIFGIPYVQTLNDISKILVAVRGTLRVLKLGLIKGKGDYLMPLPRMYKTSSTHPQDLLLKATRGLSKISKTDGLVRLHTLEILFCNHLVIDEWAQAFDFTALKSFSLIHSPNYRVRYHSPWTYFQSRRVTLKRLKTNIYVTEAMNYLRSLDSLEELYFTASPVYPNFGNFSHFSNLRVFLGVAFGTGFFIRNLQTLISGCPRLEELGIPLPSVIQSAVWSVLAHAPALRCLYFVEYKSGRAVGSLPLPAMFIFEFFRYFEICPSPLIYRLEMLSCHTVLWRLCPLASAPVEKRTLEEIRKGVDDWSGHEMSNDLRANTRPEPFCFGNITPYLNRAAVRVRWEDYQEDEMISIIRKYILR
ncbi:hypothetical protein TESG_01307 [Trichophyton tonsurans CBS 112818]|uniref:F-box domain-containing protein n=1 Tax=Trichophyton tonsurans (strain CBS 112818) TaxID=647933 RepID=F2RR25_TRIT1|nr:hypothetical protein TESG_01307 [Trichophyton tonsurans CBS 112818]